MNNLHQAVLNLGIGRTEDFICQFPTEIPKPKVKQYNRSKMRGWHRHAR